MNSFDSEYAIEGLKALGSVDPKAKVIYLTRNPLDRKISNMRHELGKQIQKDLPDVASFSVFSICSIMVDLNHVCHIRSDGLSFLSSSLINFDFWKQQMTSLVRTIPFPLHFCFCVIGLRKEPAVAVDLR